MQITLTQQSSLKKREKLHLAITRKVLLTSERTKKKNERKKEDGKKELSQHLQLSLSNYKTHFSTAIALAE
jgi:hypothetical protein